MEKYCPKCFKKYPQDAERCPEDGSYLVSTTDRDLTGEVLDERYTILERIGRGGMGVVYRAEQHLIKRIVALKVLRRDIVQDESAVKRFLNEARAIASLDSRHTVTLHDFGVTKDGLLYYTMELLKGRPLARIIRDEAPVDHVRAASLLLQACGSLEEAHEHNILHRDIKPDNLFVTVKKGREQLKVLDFGIAKLVGDTSMDTVTRAGMIIGTPQYLSPEQALGNAVVPASDLYSLAIVFYEMLAGKPPFIDDTPMKTMWAHIRDPVPSLRKTNPKVQVPRSIEAFLARALEKEPGKRFRSAVAFAEALRKAVEDHDASPETVSLPPLSTTDQGLRVRTQVWNGKKIADGGPVAKVEEGNGEDSARGTRALDVGVLGERDKSRQADRLERTARAEPHTSGGEAGESVAPTSNPVPKVVPTAWAEVPSEQSDSDVTPSVRAKAKLELQDSREEAPEVPRQRTGNVRQLDQSEPLTSPNGPSVPANGGSSPTPIEENLPVASEPPVPLLVPDDTGEEAMGPETRSLLMPARNRLSWVIGLVSFVALVAIVVVWRPWNGGESPGMKGSGKTHKHVVTGQEEGAKKTDGPPNVVIPEIVLSEHVQANKVEADTRNHGHISSHDHDRKEEPCVPSCAGRECGDDSCGGTCGECSQHSGSYCTTDGTCACKPACDDGECGGNGCGGSCGECNQFPNSFCTVDKTCGCNPNCEDKECGDNGCGGSCGKCDEFPKSFCTADGTCGCTPNCEGRECGNNGCGGSCGECKRFPGSYCTGKGTCRCRRICRSKDCGDDGCDGTCGSCNPGERCKNGRCKPFCQPSCDGKECGDDGCGGLCGSCPSGSYCQNEECLSEADRLVAKGKKAMEAQQFEKAIDLFREAQEKGASAALAGGLIRKCFGQIRERECRKLLSQGDKAINNKNWKECVAHFESAVKMCGSNPHVEEKLKKCKDMTAF